MVTIFITNKMSYIFLHY